VSSNRKNRFFPLPQKQMREKGNLDSMDSFTKEKSRGKLPSLDYKKEGEKKTEKKRT